MARILTSSIVTCFSEQTVGTKVYDKDRFLDRLGERLRTFVFPENGQGYVPFDEYLSPPEDSPQTSLAVSAGVARRKNVPIEGYHVREYRGEVGLFARRKYVEQPEHLAAIVYTLAAYLGDPGINEAERKQIEAQAGSDGEAVYVLVAVLATVGPKPPVSSHRFVRNLAGANRAYSSEQGYTLEKAIADCKAIVEYEKDWITVADDPVLGGTERL